MTIKSTTDTQFKTRVYFNFTTFFRGLALGILVFIFNLFLKNNTLFAEPKILAAVQGDWYQPLHFCPILGVTLAVIALFWQMEGPLELYRVAPNAKYYANTFLFSSFYFCLYLCGVALYIFSDVYIRQVYLGGDWQAHAQTLFSHSWLGILGWCISGVVTVMMTMQTYEELYHRDCFLIIDETYIEWVLPVHEDYGPPKAMIHRQAIDIVQFLYTKNNGESSNVYLGFQITTKDKKVWKPNEELFKSFSEDMRKQLIRRYSDRISKRWV